MILQYAAANGLISNVFFLFMQDALNDILTEARKEIGANLKTALFDHLTFCTSRSTASFRLENLMIEFDENHIHSQQTPLRQ